MNSESVAKTNTSTINTSTVKVNDDLLLSHYSHSRAPEPFLELVRRHTGLVYGTCFRIVANVHDAEELTQECFFDLSRQADRIRTSLVGWLHQAATHRALNRIRGDKRRKVHEQEASLGRLEQVAGNAESANDLSWNEISLLVDQALVELPEQLRTPIILRYLEGATQADVANSLGVHQSTVSRRLLEGIERLRETIRKAGFVVPTAALISWLATQSATAAPPTLAPSIGKIGLAGVGTSILANVGGGGFMAGLAGVVKGTIALLLVPVVAGILWGEIVFVMALAVWCGFIGLRRPEWIRVLCYTRQFPNIYEWPFFPFTRWKWQKPPREWQIWMAFYFVTGIQLLGLIILPDNVPKPSSFLITIAVLWQFSMGARIWLRVRRCRIEFPDAAIETELPVDGALLLTYALAGVVLVAKVCASPWFLSQPDNGRGIFWLNLFSTIYWATVLIWGSILVVGRFSRWREQTVVDPILSNWINEFAPPRLLLGTLMVIPLAIAFLYTFVTLMQDLLPVYVPFGDNAIAVTQRRMFAMTLAAMDCLVFVILPLGYLYRRIPRIAWGVAFGIVGIIGTLNLGLFAKTILAAPVITVPPRYAPLPGIPLTKGHFLLQNPPNLLANDSLKSDFKYMGQAVTRSVVVGTDVTISVKYGEHKVFLSIPKSNERDTEVVVIILVAPDEFQNGVPSQLKVHFALSVPYQRKQISDQFNLPIAVNLSPDDWKTPYEFVDHELEKAYPIGETITLGTVQGKPLTFDVEGHLTPDNLTDQDVN